MQSILKLYRSAPFIPVATDSSMLSVLLLLSKYRMRNVPVIEQGQPFVKNYITQSAIIRGLEKCRGRDWFDCIAAHPISDLGLPFMSQNEVRLPRLLNDFSSRSLLNFEFQESCFISCLPGCYRPEH